jgi:NUMOD4 motif/HNH endonuclease
MKYTEKWKDIPGHEGVYEVSTVGRVRRTSRPPEYKGKLPIPYIMKNQYDKDGYCTVRLRVKNSCKNGRVHQLVALTFLPNPENLPIPHHLNGVRDDNRVVNLEWVSSSKNSKYTYEFGSRKQFGEHNNSSLLSNKDVVEIKSILLNKKPRQKPFIKDIASKFNVSRSCIQNIASSNYWKHI